MTASPHIYTSRNVDEAVKHVKMLMANLDVVKLSTVVKEKEDFEQYFDIPESGEIRLYFLINCLNYDLVMIYEKSMIQMATEMFMS